ncbi:hypothetical protein FKM82_029347 [Ascaphus truei]
MFVCALPAKTLRVKRMKTPYIIKSFMNCNTQFVVYYIWCACTKGYVGRTIRPLKQRISEHTRLIKNGDIKHPVSRHCLQCSPGGLKPFHFVAIEHVPLPV